MKPESPEPSVAAASDSDEGSDLGSEPPFSESSGSETLFLVRGKPQKRARLIASSEDEDIA